MKTPKKLNRYLVLLIIGMAIAWFSFEFGYSLGERKGYVMGVNKCLDEIKGTGEELSYPTDRRDGKAPI